VERRLAGDGPAKWSSPSAGHGGLGAFHVKLPKEEGKDERSASGEAGGRTGSYRIMEGGERPERVTAVLV